MSRRVTCFAVAALFLFFFSFCGKVDRDVYTAGLVIEQQGQHKENLSCTSRHEGPKVLIMEATAYSASPAEGTADGITASGTKARRGTAAVDPKVIPLGTRLWVEGYGYAVAEDTGGAIKGMRIDLFVESREEALRFGRKAVRVRILE